MTSQETVSRARQSEGISSEPIYELVARTVRGLQLGRPTVVDVGCGSGNLYRHLCEHCEHYLGVDIIRYDGFPTEAEFVGADLESGRVPLPDASADVVTAVEVIEHVENPRAFVRELTRIAKPGGVVVVTTPNQLSLLSLLSLVVKQRFAAFQDVHYPAHLTALLEVDLRRIAAEAGLEHAEIVYSRHGRIPATARDYPKALSGLFPRGLSDNVLLAARRPV